MNCSYCPLFNNIKLNSAHSEQRNNKKLEKHNTFFLLLPQPSIGNSNGNLL